MAVQEELRGRAATGYADFFGPDVGLWWPLAANFGNGATTSWHMRAPCGHRSVLDPGHEVAEHGDGTISVTPSLVCAHEGCGWHGFLKRGVWSTV